MMLAILLIGTSIVNHILRLPTLPTLRRDSQQGQSDR